MTPEQIAAEVLHVEITTLTASRIKGGLTNESWLVQSDHDAAHHAVVVRISTTDEHALQLNRHSEALVLDCVQRAGIGADVLLCAPQRRLLVTRKLKAKNITVSAMRDPQMIDRLACMFRRLHAIGAPAGVQHINLQNILESYWRTLDEQSKPRPEDIDARSRAFDIARESDGVTERCLCHNDVHDLNVMLSGERLWWLDWEYAGIGDPLFDLASLCCYHQYTQAMRDELLSTYRGSLDPAESERLQRMCWLFDYIKTLWMQVRAVA